MAEQIGKIDAAGAGAALRAVKRREAETVYIASDADKFVTRPIAELADILSVKVVYVESMRELGKSCGISRPAAAAVRLLR